MFVLYPTKYWENVWILEYRYPVQERVCVGGELPKPSPAQADLKKSSNRDLAAMEKTCAKSTPYSFETCLSRVHRPTE